MSTVRSLVAKVRMNEKQRLDALCAWLLEHLYEPIGWQALTEQSGLSHEELSRLFQTHHEVTPMQWIRLQREKLMGAMANNKVVEIRSLDAKANDRLSVSRDEGAQA
jgi:transcriptional regulator GlxA family with amidase domain